MYHLRTNKRKNWGLKGFYCRSYSIHTLYNTPTKQVRMGRGVDHGKQTTDLRGAYGRGDCT